MQGTVPLHPINYALIPDQPGIYQFLDSSGKILYIGKARNLRNRIRQYLQEHDSRPLIPRLMHEAQQVRCIVTGSEKEAFILENNLIKQNQPPYNIDLRDDKSYPFLALTNEEFPALIIVRNPGHKYRWIRGPFTDVKLLRMLVRVILSTYPLKRCTKKCMGPCLNYQIGLCPAPYSGKIAPEEYVRRLKTIMRLLEGKGWQELQQSINRQIREAAERLDFEQAAALRDALAQVPNLLMKLGVEQSRSGHEDFFIFSTSPLDLYMTIGVYREGRLEELLQYRFPVTDHENITGQALLLLSSFYQSRPIPERIGISPDQFLQHDILSGVLEAPVKFIKIPEAVVLLLQKNHEIFAGRVALETESSNEALAALQQITGTETASIMCLDISTLGGTYTVSGAVWWESGSFKKEKYRRFRIKTVEGQNDFHSLAEVVRRLQNRWKAHTEQIPDLLLIDGGKGQVSAVSAVLETGIPVLGIVKDRKKERGYEMLVTVAGDEIPLAGTSLHRLMARIRDETHRFSITYNRTLRTQALTTGLTDIPGIGPVSEKLLLSFFGTIENISRASLEELKAVPGLKKKQAETIYRNMHR